MAENFDWVLQLFGRLHPLLVHFPIALLVVAFFLELFTLKGKNKGLRQGINAMVYLGAFFSVFSALFGWLLKTQEDYSGNLVDNHQYAGIATAVLALLTALLLRKAVLKSYQNLKLYRVLLAVTFVILAISGHLGANLTHGEDYLSSVLPSQKKAYTKVNSTALLTEINGAETLSKLQQDKLNLEVRGLFAHKCYQCHSENKQKGKLVLETKEGVFKGGVSGLSVIPGKPEESELFRRITLPADHKKVMPTKGKLLSKNEIELVKLWIKNGAHWADAAVKVFPEAALSLQKPKLPQNNSINHPVDKIVNEYFKENNIKWPNTINDRKFIKRVYMDVVGLLPTPEKIENFIKNNQVNKRTVLIDSLLNDHKNYTQNWLSFWNDLLRNDYSGTGFITGGREQITNWLYTSLLNNNSYDQMVKELINPNKGSRGFIKGIKWRGVVNASQRTEMQAAQNIGQSLMGANVKCASCHNSFVSNITLKQAYGFASVFSDSILELNRCDIPIGKFAKPSFLYPELGEVEGNTIKERLLKLSEIMVHEDNGRLYRTLTNRFWNRLMGRGIIMPVDEMDNTPWNAELLDWLAADFIESKSDLKHLLRQIMTSKTYQLENINYNKQADLKSNYVFKGPVLRRLSAEQFSDAVSQVIYPLFSAVEYHPDYVKINAKRVWHAERSDSRIVLPKPGKRYFRKSFQLSNVSLKSAEVLITVDNSYILYINGNKILQGKTWGKVGKAEVKKYLKSGENTIAVLGENDGLIGNPAGVLFSLKVKYENGKTINVNSDKTWKSTNALPPKNWISQNFDDTKWKNVFNYGRKDKSKLINFTFSKNTDNFARASLVKQHPFMKALGRPSREIVATTREEQATLLQALELTNGVFFNTILEDGAASWLQYYKSNTSLLVEDVYQKLLGRNPTAEEKDIIIKVLGNQPNKEQLQDVFWSILLLPEFQFIS